MARTNRLRLNFLGVISLLIGVAACVATKVPILGYGPVSIALLGISVGVLGFLLSIMTGHWGSGWPVLGILVGSGALALVGYDNGTLPQWWAKFHPETKTPIIAAPRAAPPVATPAEPGATHQRSIFDTPGTYSSEPARNQATPTANIPPASPAVMAQHPGTIVPRPAGPTLQQANARFDAAMTALDRTLSNDPAYVQAKKDLADADARRKAALSTDGAGSAAAIKAASEWLDAKTKLRKLLDTAAAKDPATESARQALKDAEANSRGVK